MNIAERLPHFRAWNSCYIFASVSRAILTTTSFVWMLGDAEIRDSYHRDVDRSRVRYFDVAAHTVAHSVAMWFPPIPSPPPPFYDFIEQWKANRTCSECTCGKHGYGRFVVSYRFFSGGCNRQSLSAHLIMDMEEFVINRLYKFRKLWIPCRCPCAASFELWRRDKREGATLIQQICNCCFQPVVLSSDRFYNCSEDKKFVSIGRIYCQSNEEEVNCVLIFSNWQIMLFERLIMEN